MSDIGTAIMQLKLAMAKAGASGEATVTLHREDLHLVETALRASVQPLEAMATDRPLDGFDYAGIQFRPQPRSILNPLRRIT